jgi:sugar/nucleoside kinase (ribokinase family)
MRPIYLYEKIISDTAKHVHVHVAGYYNIEGFWNGALLAKMDFVRTERKRRHPDSIVTVSLAPQYDASGAWDGGLRQVLPLLDFAVMNDLEAKHIVGNVSVERWATFFQEHCTNTWIVVTRGKEGAIAIRNGRVLARQITLAVEPMIRQAQEILS